MPDYPCPECRRSFYGPKCFTLHRTRNIAQKLPPDNSKSWTSRWTREVCRVWQKCENCGALLKGTKSINTHVCGERKCQSCHKRVASHDHRCFIQVEKACRCSGPSNVIYVFFDIEAYQTEQGHVPNLLVCQRHDQEMFYQWYGEQCVRHFAPTRRVVRRGACASDGLAP